MFFWFLGCGCQLVRVVFRSRGIDYRVLAVGLTLPVSEVLLGRVVVVHTLAFAVAVFVSVAVVTGGRRLLARRWAALPIGLMVHLLLDGSWARPELFWWPLRGSVWHDLPPETGRPVWMVVAMEAVGLAALVSFLRSRDRRDREAAS